jgi:hypothetical protein
MFDKRAATATVSFMSLGLPGKVQAPEYAQAGDFVSLRIGNTRIEAKILREIAPAEFDGMLTEIELPEEEEVPLLARSLNVGQPVRFTEDMIYSCARGA